MEKQISVEGALLKAMSVREYYEKYSRHIDKPRLMPNTALLLKDYKLYYTMYQEHEEIDFSTFFVHFAQDWHKKDMDQDDINYYLNTVLPLIEKQELQPQIIATLIENQTVESLKEMLESGIDSSLIEERIADYEKRRKEVMGEKDDDVFSLDEVDVSVLDTSKGLPWFLPALQAGIGSMMPGQFIVLAADSNTGKSAFCISQAVSVFEHQHTLAADERRPILYCTSEDTKEDLVCRFLSNLYRKNVVEGFDGVISQFDRVKAHFNKKYDSRLFIGMQIHGARDLYKIKQKIDAFNPCVIIIDMVDSLSKSRDYQELENLYQAIRGIANTGYPVLGTTQSGNTTYQDKDTKEYKHRKHLSEKDMAGSKYGKQGAAYCAIMIGKDDDHPNLRYINTTKKKRGQHVQCTAEIIERFSLYKELL